MTKPRGQRSIQKRKSRLFKGNDRNSSPAQIQAGSRASEPAFTVVHPDASNEQNPAAFFQWVAAHPNLRLPQIEELEASHGGNETAISRELRLQFQLNHLRYLLHSNFVQASETAVIECNKIASLIYPTVSDRPAYELKWLPLLKEISAKASYRLGRYAEAAAFADEAVEALLLMEDEGWDMETEVAQEIILVVLDIHEIAHGRMQYKRSLADIDWDVADEPVSYDDESVQSDGSDEGISFQEDPVSGVSDEIPNTTVLDLHESVDIVHPPRPHTPNLPTIEIDVPSSPPSSSNRFSTWLRSSTSSKNGQADVEG